MTYDNFDHLMSEQSSRRGRNVETNRPTAKTSSLAAIVLFRVIRQMVANGEIDPNRLGELVSNEAFEVSNAGNPRRSSDDFLKRTGQSEDVIDYVARAVDPRRTR